MYKIKYLWKNIKEKRFTYTVFSTIPLLVYSNCRFGKVNREFNPITHFLRKCEHKKMSCTETTSLQIYFSILKNKLVSGCRDFNGSFP